VTAGYQPESIDDLALVGNSIPPYRVRQSLA
jgi:spermidine synthase